jgi:ribosomal protein L40E
MVLAITPIVLYISILVIPLVLSVALRYLIVVPTRECIQCDRVVAVTAFSCRHCGHRYTAEDREWMRLRAEQRKAEGAAHELAAAAVKSPLPASVIRPRPRVTTLQCIRCDGKVAVNALSCRHCGYKYDAEERDLMRLRAGVRQR